MTTLPVPVLNKSVVIRLKSADHSDPPRELDLPEFLVQDDYDLC